METDAIWQRSNPCADATQSPWIQSPRHTSVGQMKEPTPELLARRARLGERVRELRRAKGVSQEELAHVAGLDRSYVGAVERGERNLGVDNLWRLADALEIGAGDLFSR